MRKMKDSGIEWIGEIPEGWEVCKLKYLATVQTGNTPSMNNENLFFSREKGIPWIKAENLNTDMSIEKTEQYLTPEGVNEGRLFPKNTIYICCIASIGKVGFSCIEASCNQQINALSFNDKFYWKYGFYLSKAQEEEYLLLASGNVVKILNSERQKNMFCPFPPLYEQQQIVDFLDRKCSEIDSVISKTRETIEEYKKLKQAIITEAVTKGLNPNAKMKNSGIEWIGEIPEEWKKIKFKYLHYGMNTGEAIDKEYWSSNEYDRVFYTAGLFPIRTTYLEFPEWKLTRDNDLLLSRNGTPYVYLPSEYACYTDHIIRAKIKKDVCKKFLQYALQRSISTIVVNQVSIATWSASLWNEQILPFPPLSEQQQIADYLDQKCSEIDNLITKKEQLVVELEAYKKSLIYEVVTGKREV